MRIPGRNIWRAFRELDRFSDDQCRRFVRSANRLSWSSAFRGIFLFVLGAGLLLGLLYLLARISSDLDKGFRSDIVEWIVLLPLWTGGIALSPLTVLVVRDWFLIRRIRKLFHTRGQCIGCRYSLIGLPVDKSLTVVCPECGTNTTVDVSLGELASDETGQSRFEPKPGAIADVPTFWTPRRKRFITRLCVGALIVAITAPLFTWGFYETCLYLQARAASTPKSRDAFADNYEAQRRKQAQLGTSGLWAAIARTIALYENIQLEEVNKITSGNRALAGHVDASSLWDNIPRDDSNINEAESLHRRERQFAKAAAISAVDRSIREHIFSELDDPGLGPQQLPLPPFDPAQPIYRTALDEGAFPALKIARLNRARMIAAREAGDAQSFNTALRSNMLISRSLRLSPLQFPAMIASVIEQYSLEACIAELEQGARSDFLHEIDATMRAWDTASSITDALEGQRLVALDCLEWLYSTPANVRWGRESAEVVNICDSGWTAPYIQPRRELRLGWYWETRDELNARFDHAIGNLKLEYWQRPPAQPPTQFALVRALSLSDVGTPNNEDTRLLLIRSVRIMIALEQFRLAHGAFPEQLDEIASMVTPDDLRDPLSGKQFGYLKLDSHTRPSCRPAASESTRAILAGKPYFLYAPGQDGIDDFAQEHDTNAFRPRTWGVQFAAPGKDLLLNTDWNRWPEQLPQR